MQVTKDTSSFQINRLDCFTNKTQSKTATTLFQTNKKARYSLNSTTVNHSMSSPSDLSAATLVLTNTSLVSEIVSSVGINQYRFVASINTSFRDAYSTVFPKNQSTARNASTLEHAKICWEEMDRNYRYVYGQRKLCRSAAKHGNLPALMYLRGFHCEWDERTCSGAAQSGHLNVLQWCRENGCPWNEDTCECAAKNGHLHVLQWCRENGCPCNGFTWYYAAHYGHLNVLQWCRENVCLWDERACRAAARYGHLHVLRWCRENGCPWDADTCRGAASKGHLNVLQWCRENGCPWHRESCIETARRNGRLHILEWMETDMRSR